MNPKRIFDLLKKTFQDWSTVGGARLGAALAYYTVFSLAPLLIIIISVAGLVFGEKAVTGQIARDIGGIVGTGPAETIQTMIRSSHRGNTGIIGTVIGLVSLFFGAVGLVGQLRDGLNIVWEAPKPKGGIVSTVLGYLLAFVVVLGVAALLAASLVLSAVVGWLGGFLNGIVPGLPLILSVANTVISFALIAVLFALIYRVLPNVSIPWTDVWAGAIFTAFLFTIGKVAIGIYLGHSNVGSSYGAAGSLVVILVWAYYSAQIIFFGASFTHVYAHTYGSRQGLADSREREMALARERARRPSVVTRVRANVSERVTLRLLAAAAVSLVIGTLTVLESWARHEHRPSG